MTATDTATGWWLLPLLMSLLAGAMGGVAGPLLVVRRRVLHSNLIAHAVLPGLALAEVSGLDPLLAGLASALAALSLAESINRRLPAAGASREVVANTLLAASLGLGVLLLQALGAEADLQGLLFGDLLTADPGDLLRSSLALLALLLLLAWRWQPLLFLAVDPEGAAAAGLPVPRLQRLLSLTLTPVLVSGMAAVGLILAIALFCAPALVGLSHAGSLRGAMARATAIAMLSCAAGFGLALLLDVPPGPLIACLCVPLLLLARVARGTQTSG